MSGYVTTTPGDGTIQVRRDGPTGPIVGVIHPLGSPEGERWVVRLGPKGSSADYQSPETAFAAVVAHADANPEFYLP